MSLRDTIKEDLKKSMQAKDSLRLSVLRMLSASFLNKEKEKRAKEMKANPAVTEEEVSKLSQLSDDEATSMVLSEIKKRKDSIEQYSSGGRDDLVLSEKKELEILENYAPEQMLEDDVRKIVKAAITKVGANSVKDIGKVMGQIMPQVKGQADGTVVNKIVQEELSA